VVASVDINTNANKVYKHNFSNTTNISRNIESITINEIMKLDINCILMSPPCQPFTRVGLKKDSVDKRCSSLLHVLQHIPQIKTLKYLLLENVKGFECSQARDAVILSLNQSEFNYKEFILSPCQFGIPNSRHRYYLIAKKKGLKFIFNGPNFLTSISEEILQFIPEKIYKSLPVETRTFNSRNKIQCFKIKHILEEDVDAQYLIPKNILMKRGSILDVRTSESIGSCCFTKAYSHYVEGTGSVLSPNPNFEILKDFVKDTEIVQNKTQALLDLKLRYFTPKEISRLMCFPEDFEFPNDLTNKQKYRLLGNSINVYVVSQLIYLLYYEDFVQLI
jgi:tRNA (cytosine38-C5)-methyltransferase